MPWCLHHFFAANCACFELQQSAKRLKSVVTVVACHEVLAGACCLGLEHTKVSHTCQ